MKYPTLWKIAAFLVSQACFTPVLAAPAKAPGGKTYTVKNGDTFAKIARANRVSLESLLKANRVSSPDRLRSGQRITIPGSGTTVKTTAAGKSTTLKAGTSKNTVAKTSVSKTTAHKERRQEPPVRTVSSTRGREDNTTVNISPPPRAGTYTVQSGDNLHRIQRRTGTPLTSLMKLNGLTESSIIRPGQTLRLSGSSHTTIVAKNQPAALRTATRQHELPYIQEPAPVIPAREVPRIQEQPVIQPPAAPVTPVPAVPAPSMTAPHKVESGETFSSIGRLYGVSQSKLIAANPGVSPAKLKTGQTLKIPGQPVRPGAQPVVVRADGRILAARPDPLAGGVPVSAPAERTRTGYLVEDGETLTQIAQRFHTTERELRQMNRLGDSDNIYAGRYILVPFIRQAPEGNSLARRDA
jgi:LysM repeat protein